jgi:hypothetical protein
MFKLIAISILVSCNQSFNNRNLEKNLVELDKVYGVCDNPMRQYTKAQKKTCKAKERAAGPDGKVDDPINITELIENYKNGGKTVYASSSVNTHLWNASLVLLEPYSLKIADSQGGVINTDWIMEKSDPTKRCSIKINISSQELISTGVKVNLLCEEQELENWYPDNFNYSNEEKEMTIKILAIAQELKDTADLASN